MTLQLAFDNFIFSRQIQGLAEKSIDCYVSFIKPFVAHIGSDLNISALNRDLVNGYINTLLKRTLSRATVSTYIRHIKIFLKWIEEEYEICVQADKIKVPKTPKKVLHIYTDDEIVQIFNMVHAEEEWLRVRNCCIIALMLDSGLRQNEVCTLLRAEINFQSCTMKICGKGNKERVVPFGKITKHYMTLYNNLCPYQSEYFLVARHGDSLTTNAVKLFMRKIAIQLPFPFSSHKLRHNFATNYCINQYEQHGKVDIYALMLLMGHEDVETTQRYLHFAQQIIATKTSISHLDKVLIS
ncbi:MAG: tyrosine-type recombinase/integrase [Tyzzerella sp.]|nr:tyrosine-type recombinase/integrase [Tyzzerella sp.]